MLLVSTRQVGVISALVSAALTGALACGGATPQQVTIQPPPAPLTRATLSGPLCEADVCTCRDENEPADGGAGEPETEGVKRFEVKVGPAANPLWVQVDGMVLYKSEQRATDCFYLDLRPGPHKVVLRGSRDGGLSAAVTISEYAAGTKSWYQSFQFSCGSPGMCSHDELDGEKARFATLAREQKGVHDRCGSVKVKGISWDTGRSPDQQYPNELLVRATLDVYKFVPDRPHGDDCSKKQAEERTEDNPIQ